MSYAIISSWMSTPEISAASGGLDTLNNVIVPMVKASPGFVRGYWTEADAGDDQQELLGYAEYDTKRNAEAMAAMMSSATPPPGVVLPPVGPALSWAKVVQVVASA
jgi:hypothetical protein